MKRFLLSVIIVFFSTLAAFSQAPAYKLDFKIEGLNDTTLLLGHYYSESTYAKDTAKSVNGVFSFDGKKALPPGMYFIIKGKIKLFELLVSNNQKFQMTTSTKDYVANMKVTGDYDNQLFFENMRFNVERNTEAEPHVKVMQDSTASEEAKKTAREALIKINDKVMAYQDGIIAKYPESFTAKLFKTTKRIDVPEPPKRADGSIDSTFQLRYYREH
ncbi:MAG: DUF4369 domain-containing protein, partial [Cytophagia bacterium]|nr:DUF4369 domain-containing protein [Cytophagia bacterium]